MASKKNDSELNRLLKCMANLFNAYEKNGIPLTAKNIEKMAVVDANETRKQLIIIITEEVCKFYQKTYKELYFGKGYCYNVPRLITYKLLYEHANSMTMLDIANYFDKSLSWIQRCLRYFRNLNQDHVSDKKILDHYDIILKKILLRVVKLNKPQLKQGVAEPQQATIEPNN